MFALVTKLFFSLVFTATMHTLDTNESCKARPARIDIQIRDYKEFPESLSVILINCGRSTYHFYARRINYNEKYSCRFELDKAMNRKIAIYYLTMYLVEDVVSDDENSEICLGKVEIYIKDVRWFIEIEPPEEILLEIPFRAVLLAFV